MTKALPTSEEIKQRLVVVCDLIRTSTDLAELMSAIEERERLLGELFDLLPKPREAS